MKLLAEISEVSLGIGEPELLNTKYELRKSARAIVLNEEGKMATQYLENYTFHKLPGGGVDLGETIEDTMRREVKEEVGCDSEIVKTIGVTIEYRNKYRLLHVSYCFAAKVAGEVGVPILEKGEIEEGQVTRWLQPTEVLKRMQEDKPKKYEGHFILKRETSFLEEYLKMDT